MLRSDVLALAVGDSVFGLWNDWDDERVVVGVAKPERGSDGRLFRTVSVAYGLAHVSATIVENGPEIRGVALRTNRAA
jgi:hypothetical protein